MKRRDDEKWRVLKAVVICEIASVRFLSCNYVSLRQGQETYCFTPRVRRLAPHTNDYLFGMLNIFR